MNHPLLLLAGYFNSSVVSGSCVVSLDVFLELLSISSFSLGQLPSKNDKFILES